MPKPETSTDDNKKGRCQRHRVFPLAGTFQEFSCQIARLFQADPPYHRVVEILALEHFVHFTKHRAEYRSRVDGIIAVLYSAQHSVERLPKRERIGTDVWRIG